MKKKIAILISFFPNPRINKRIALEKKIGDVHLVCWDKGQTQFYPPNDNEIITHIISIKAHSNPLKRIMPYRRFSQCAMNILNEIEPNIIHVQGLDMLRIAIAYKKHSHKPVSVVYEVSDLHRLIMDKQKHPIKKVVQYYLKREDKKLEKYYDTLIITSEMFYELYFKHFVSKEKTIYMPNIPDFSAFNSFHRKEVDPLNYTIGFIGWIRYKQEMRNLIVASEKSDIKLLIAGFENDPNEIEQLCNDKPYIKWTGKFDFKNEAAELYEQCDAIYAVYDADIFNVRVALPNKLYESVFCEIPIIVAKDTYLAQIVEKWGVGIAVDHKNVDELISAITQLRDDKELNESIRSNCRLHKDEINLDKYNKNLIDRFIEILDK